MSVTSVVAFITNDKLKAFIKEVQENFKELLEETYKSRGERNFESILETQYIIRQYLVDHQHRIDFSTAGFILRDGHAKSMPSLFGLYMMVVSDLDHVYTIEDVMKQIERRNFFYLGQEVDFGIDASGVVFDGTELHEDKLCCCSHRCNIENMGAIRNQYTKYSIVVGSECIHKNKLIDRDVILREQKKTVKYIEKKKIADKIKEDKKQLKEDEKRRKLEEQREAYRQEQIKKRIEKEKFERKLEETRIEINGKEQLYVEKYGRTSNDIKSFFGDLYNKTVDKPVEKSAEKPVEKPVEKPAVRNFTILEPRTYLNISYANKDKAKEMGAFYDANHRKWCIRPYCRNPLQLLKEYKVIPDPRKN